VSRHHPLVLSLLEPSPTRVCTLGSSMWRRGAAANAAGNNSMLTCVRSRVVSSSTCAMWAWPRRCCRPSPRPRAPAWVPPRALLGLPRLRLSVEGEDLPFFPSPWQASHCSRVKCNFPSTVIGPERGCGSSSSTTLRRPITSSIDNVERSSRDSIERGIYLYFSGMQRKSFSMALSSS
jgi:hypothetical protein